MKRMCYGLLLWLFGWNTKIVNKIELKIVMDEIERLKKQAA